MRPPPARTTSRGTSAQTPDNFNAPKAVTMAAVLYVFRSLVDDDIPLMLHARYLDLELSAAFGVVSGNKGEFRNFYTGVEPVCDGRYDLLLVTLEKSDSTDEHLRYKDYPLQEALFHWQSQSDTRQSDTRGRRHVQPASQGVTPLLFVRERKKDARGVTCAFRFLGAVTPERVEGERPISITWRLGTPLRAEWVRRWGQVG